MAGAIELSVQAVPTERASWCQLAQRCEAAGFATLSVPDHPGTTPAPFVALAVAAAVTERIRLATYVINAGMWEPLELANEVATLDLLSDGRAVLGIGAGHTPAEWTMNGRGYPSGAQRVARMIEVAEVAMRLLAGDTVSYAGDHVQSVEAHLDAPRSDQARVPLLVGGNGRRLLRYAAERADIIGLAGLGRTLPDGHRHTVDMAPDRIDDQVASIRRAAAEAGREPRLDALVQVVQVTDDAERVAAELAAGLQSDHPEGVRPEHLLAAPYVLIGTVEEIAEELRGHRRRWGITRFTVRSAVIDEAEGILAALADA